MIKLQPGDKIDIRGTDNRIVFGQIVISSITISSSYGNSLLMEMKGEMYGHSFYNSGVGGPYYIISDGKKFQVNIKKLNFDRYTSLSNVNDFGMDRESSSTYYSSGPCTVDFLLCPDNYESIAQYETKEIVEMIEDRWSILDL